MNLQDRIALSRGRLRVSAPSAPSRIAAARNCCGQCGNPFGLVRRRRAGKQFCSAQCVEAYAEEARKATEASARWHAFLSPKR